MKISYVLVVRDEQSHVAWAIRSLLKQSVKGELIVINDASTDSTDSIIKYINRNNKFLYIKVPYRKGAAYCRNLGNSLASGDIIAVCDADHYYKDRGKAIMEFFKKHPEKSIFYSALHLEYPDIPGQIQLMEAYEWDFKSKCPISHPTVAYRTQVAKECPYYEKSVETDLFEFMLLKAHSKGYLFGGCQNPLMLKFESITKRNRAKADKLKRAFYRLLKIKV